MDMEQVRQRIVQLSRIGENDISGLGIITNNKVLTCAGHDPHLKTGPFGYCTLDATRVATGHQCQLDSVLATSWDFMILDADSLEVKSDEHEGDVYEVLLAVEDEEGRPPLPACRISMDDTHSRHYNGYFFMPDGVTTYPVQFALDNDSLFIYAYVDEELDTTGCGGGPLMTEDHQLVGIIVGRFSNGMNRIRAIRIDLAMPEYLSRRWDWQTLDNTGKPLAGEARVMCAECGGQLPEAFSGKCAGCGKPVCVDCTGEDTDPRFCTDCFAQNAPDGSIDHCPTCEKKACSDCFPLEFKEQEARAAAGNAAKAARLAPVSKFLRK